MTEKTEKHGGCSIFIKWATPIIFAALIFGFGAAILIAPDKEYSYTENRKLEQLPKFTMGTLISGKYATSMEKYLTDQFVFRDSFISIKTQSDYLVGKRDTNGVYFGSDGYLFEVYDEAKIDRELLDKNLGRLSQLAKKQLDVLGADNVNVMLIPSASEIISDKLPPLAPVFNQSEAFSSLEKTLPQGVYIDAAAALKAHSSEELYYKTDHHWTSLGAYYGYRELCRVKGVEGTRLEAFDVKTVSEDFYGTLYNKARLVTTKPDKIEIYSPKRQLNYSLDYNLGQKQTDSLYDEDYLQKRDQYSYFLSGNNAVVKIDTENKNEKTLLVLKDSFSHSLAPFLALEYEKLYFLDLRYYNGSVSDFIENNSVTDLLAVYHTSTLESDTNMVKLNS